MCIISSSNSHHPLIFYLLSFITIPLTFTTRALDEFHPWAVNPAVVQNFNETHSPAFGDDLPGGNIVLYPTKPGFPDLTFPFEFYPGWPHVPPPKSVAEFKAMVASAEGNGTASGGEDGAPAAPAAAEKK